MIDLERWDEIKEIMQAALDLPAEQQAAFLEEACRGDEELQRQVEVLLAVSPTRADIYDNFVIMPPGVHATDFNEGDEIATYRIVRPLGTGGMSTVYLADDPRHERQVAVKVLKVPRRRRREEQIVARFHHENIATFHDSGQVEGGPAYFVMEYVDGEPITTYCETRALSVDDRLKLFLTVCEAVAYAHGHLVVHRDLKPANILVTQDGVPKLLDFGIAKTLSPSLAEVTNTAPEDRALTVAFASPEQLDGETTLTATDIYSLGVLLCIMLTGHLPYRVKSYHDLPWAVRNMEAERPSQLVKEPPPRLAGEQARPITESETRKLERKLRGDLDAIVLKALRKEPDQRYSTAAELAADVGRYLSDEPVSARRGTTTYRAQKFIARNLIPSLTGFTVLVLIFLFLLTLANNNRSLRIERDRSARIATFLSSLFEAADPTENEGDLISARTLLERARSTLLTDPTIPDRDRAYLLHALAKAFWNLRITPAAEDLINRTIQISRDLPDRDFHLEHQSYNTLVFVYLGQDKLAKAEQAALNAARSSQKDPLKSTVTEAATEHALGLVLYRQAKLSDAKKHFARALRLLSESVDVDNRELTADALHAFGITLSDNGEYEHSYRYLTRALQILEYKLPNNPRTAQILVTRAILLLRQGKPADARRDLEASLKIKIRLFGRSNFDTARTLYLFGSVYRAEGNYHEAERYLTEAISIFRSTPGDNRLVTATALSNLGVLVSEVGRLREAELLLRQALEIEERLLGSHYETATSLNNLAVLLRDQGKLPEALNLYQRSLMMRRSSLGPQHPQVAESLNNLGEILGVLGRATEGKQMHEQAVEVAEAALGKSHENAILYKRNLSVFLLDHGEPDRAILLLRELEQSVTALGPDHHLSGVVQVTLCHAYNQKKQYAVALEKCDKADAVLKVTLPPDHFFLIPAALIRAETLVSLGRTAEAAELIKETLPKIETSLGLASKEGKKALLLLKKTARSDS